MRRPEPVTAADLGIEAVTTFRTSADKYRNMEPKTEGSAARLIPISLARVRWLEVPVDWIEEDEECGE